MGMMDEDDDDDEDDEDDEEFWQTLSRETSSLFHCTQNWDVRVISDTVGVRISNCDLRRM